MRQYKAVTERRNCDPNGVGKRISQVRLYYGLSQQEFADRIHIHQSTVALFETGKRYLREIYTKLICDEFGVSEEWLLHGIGKMIRPAAFMSIEDYTEKYNLSPVERDIVLNFMDLTEKAKQESLETFVRSIAATKEEQRKAFAK